MDKNQIELLQVPFSPAEIRQREGHFGKMLDYIETHSVIARLNGILDGDWSFQVVSWEVNQEADEVIVLGKLHAGDITKMQFGSAKCTRNKQTGDLISFGDSLKAAASDSVKKCATLLGVGLHLYRPEEVATTPPPAQDSEPSSTQRQPSQPSAAPSGNRITAKQKSLILQLASEAGLSHTQITQHSQQVYGRTVDFLSKADASKLIENLFSGQVKAA